jgi:hypothetical protein
MVADKYWTVEFTAFAFDTADEASDFRDKLTDAFCGLNTAGYYGCATQILAQIADDEKEHSDEA